ncbi:MAG: ImmA/IrrE family metallo-endopeptidase [Syntrophaceae bacterium]|nr:ImmA/IrrE family metallo-endopeptidase [Syntrophaceae bacterium]
MGKRPNKYIQHMCAEYGVVEPYHAVSLFVDSRRSDSDSLESLCCKLGVAEILREDIDFEGGVFREDTRFIIKLNARSPATRQRFTLAHELAHLMMALEKTTYARRSFTQTDMESTCDMVAAELLMPYKEIQEQAAGNASLDKLLTITHNFQVSFQAAAMRISNLKLWKHSFGFWKWDKGAHELWFVGKKLWLTPRPFFVAFDIAMQNSQTVKRRELYDWHNGEVRSALIEVRKIGQEYLLALVLG